MPFETGLKNAIINHFFRNTAQTPAATVYVGLLATATEFSAGNYARVAATFGAPSGGIAANSGAVNFASPSVDWGTATHFGIYDAPSGGNRLTYDALSASKACPAGSSPSFAIGALQVEVGD